MVSRYYRLYAELLPDRFRAAGLQTPHGCNSREADAREAAQRFPHGIRHACRNPAVIGIGREIFEDHDGDAMRKLCGGNCRT